MLAIELPHDPFFQQDMGYIFDRIGLPTPEVRAWGVASHNNKRSSTDLAKKLFQKMDREELDSIYHKLKFDFDAFGYKISDIVEGYKDPV